MPAASSTNPAIRSGTVLLPVKGSCSPSTTAGDASVGSPVSPGTVVSGLMSMSCGVVVSGAEMTSPLSQSSSGWAVSSRNSLRSPRSASEPQWTSEVAFTVTLTGSSSW